MGFEPTTSRDDAIDVDVVIYVAYAIVDDVIDIDDATYADEVIAVEDVINVGDVIILNPDKLRTQHCRNS